MDMNQTYMDVLALTKAAITGTRPALSQDIDWTKVMELLIKGKLLPVVYRTAAVLCDEKSIPEVLLNRWQTEAFKKGFRQLASVYELKRVLTEAGSRGIQLVVFKGIAIAALYPEPNMRYTSDADLLVSKEQRDRAEEMLLDLGYKKIDDLSKEHVPTYVFTRNQQYMAIELHDQLWEDYEGKQAELLDSLKLDDKDTLIQQMVEGMKITTLGYNEHLVFQIFHMAKHFFFEGIALRYLVDIKLYVDAYFDQIDFDKVRNDLRKLHYEKFYDMILLICHEYLGMQHNVANPELTKDDINNGFIEDLIGAEKLDDSVKQWETINFLSTYFMRTNKTKTSAFQQRRKQYFPFPSELNINYQYAKKCPLLLPVAWIHRGVYYIKYSKQCKRKGFRVSDSVAKAQYRLDLMRELDLTENEV